MHPYEREEAVDVGGGAGRRNCLSPLEGAAAHCCNVCCALTGTVCSERINDLGNIFISYMAWTLETGLQ